MELLQLDDRAAEYEWKGITFLFRTKVTVGDKYAIDSSGVVTDGDKVSFTTTEFYKSMIRVFVTGWKGVTEKGKEAPYSYSALMNRIPSSTTEDLVMTLGYHIATANGFIAAANDGENSPKNG